jgi:hypothetical protein
MIREQRLLSAELKGKTEVCDKVPGAIGLLSWQSSGPDRGAIFAPKIILYRAGHLKSDKFNEIVKRIIDILTC